MHNTKVNATMIAAAAWLLVFAIAIVTDATAQNRSQKIDYYQEYWVPCANGGEGEMVVITGTFNIVQNVAVDQNGCVHVSLHGNSMGMTAVGQTSGETFRANGNASIIQFDKTVCDETCELTFQTIDNFMIIGKGNGTKYMEHLINDWTINVCTGELTITPQKSSITCK